jgi:hypothetical protein
MMRRILLLVTVALVMVAMMLAMAMPAFAAPKGDQTPENSCGNANPEFPANSGSPPSLGDCGVENNPNYPDKPEGF